MAYNPDDLAILGLRAVFGGIDMGVLSDFSFNPSTNVYDFKSTRNGREETVRSVVISVDLTITFSTANVLDPAIIALFTGGAGGAMLFEVTEGTLSITRPNAETGGRNALINITNASIRGTGISGAAGTEAATYQFEAKALSADGAAIGTLTAGAAPATPPA